MDEITVAHYPRAMWLTRRRFLLYAIVPVLVLFAAGAIALAAQIAT